MLKKFRRYWYRLTHPIIGEVWQLHRVTDERSLQEKMQPYEITPARLEALILDRLACGDEFVSIREAANRMGETRFRVLRRKKRFIAITLDDGYADNFEVAYPILKKYNVPFCIYVCEGFVKGVCQEDGVDKYRFLTRSQLMKLCGEPLCTIGGHTSTHKALNALPKERQRDEIIHCVQWIKEEFGLIVEDYAYPYGAYCHETMALLQELGIKRAVASWGGEVRSCTGEYLLEIPRLLVTQFDLR